MIELLGRIPGLAQLLLAFAMLLAGQSWGWLYAAQVVAVGVGAAVTASVSGQATLLAVVPILLLQAVAIPRLLRTLSLPDPPGPIATLAAALLLAALAACVPFADGFAAPMAMLLLGLLGTARARDASGMRLGALLLLNGAEAAVCASPANDMAPLAVLVLGAVAAMVVSEGVPRWSALR